jgi:hypothetical protein
MNGDLTLEQLQRSLKGAPALLLWAFVFQKGPQTVKMLSQHSGYSGRVVREGLKRMESLGLVAHNADLRAWALEPQGPFLDLLRQALLGQGWLVPREAETAVFPAANKLSTELSTSPDPVDDMSSDVEEFSSREAIIADDPRADVDHGRRDFSPDWEDSAAGGDVSSAGEVAPADDYSPHNEDSAGTRDFSSVRKVESSTSPGPITITTATSTKPDPEAVSKQVRSANTRNSRSMGRDRRKIMAYWLERGGIGRKTPKMRELLASDLDLETVKAHVLERLAWEAGLTGDGPPYTPGLLITKLLAGDPPPLMRCEECLALPDKLGLCRCDYDLLVRR